MFTISVDSVTSLLNSLLDKEISAATAAGWTVAATELSALKTMLANSPQIIETVTNAVNLAISSAETEITTLAGSLAMKAIASIVGAGSLFGAMANAQAAAAQQAAAMPKAA